MARLRNRIRKADYFTDGELLRWHRDKRATYSGLWALAEDSGCLEDDPFMWKLMLWPSPLDADIPVELLTQWRDELVDAGKLVPYEADGERFLYIRTFLQHEHPRNPQRPDLPLPPWVQHEATVHKRGDSEVTRHTYSVSSDMDSSPVCDSTVTVVSPPPRPAPSRVPKGTLGTGDGPVDNSTVRSVPDNGHDRVCWRCGKPISGDELLDDKAVLSRKGLRHVECSEVVVP